MEIMNNLSASVNNSSLEWRRNKVQELASQGYNQSEISRILQISQPTINRYISYLRQQAKNSIKRYIDERLPEEYGKCLVGLNAITKEAWNTAHNTEDKREKIQALSLAKECYSMKLDSKDKEKSLVNNNDEKEQSSSLDYNDDEDKEDEDQKTEELE
jgi:predicted transcriptional regulator